LPGSDARSPPDVGTQQEGATVEVTKRRRADIIPLRRANDREDVIASVVFLASAGAGNIAGRPCNVDRGLILD
jgi:NAD(P)-dependent dehydrogenase (short-subunit alcohol dehydrogenase family)